MTARKRQTKREREPLGEPTTEQASVPQNAAESVRARAWEMHLRGIPKTRIAQALSLDRGTVARIITACYAEVASDQKFNPARKLGEAVTRMRRLQEQAWADHDADDEREQAVLALSVGGAPADPDGKRGRDSSGSSVTVKYQSQRSQYLRIMLNAEKEIARLEGLYDSLLDVEGGAVFSIRMLSQEDVARLSGARKGIAAPWSDAEMSEDGA